MSLEYMNPKHIHAQIHIYAMLIIYIANYIQNYYDFANLAAFLLYINQILRNSEFYFISKYESPVQLQ